jgi:hypothetical protein
MGAPWTRPTTLGPLLYPPSRLLENTLLGLVKPAQASSSGVGSDSDYGLSTPSARGAVRPTEGVIRPNESAEPEAFAALTAINTGLLASEARYWPRPNLTLGRSNPTSFSPIRAAAIEWSCSAL